MKTHWRNPWTDAVPVPIDELAAACHGIGQQWQGPEGPFIMTVELMLQHWRSRGPKLDAYILPESGLHTRQAGWLPSIGVRYGNDGPEYLSPMGDTLELLVHCA